MLESSNNGGCHDGHRERVRRRFESEGLHGFEPHEVLELLLFYAIPQRDTNKVAHALLEKFGSIDLVFDADIAELMKVNGIGRNSAVLIKLISQTAQYYARTRFKKVKVMETIEQVGEYMCSQIGILPQEVFVASAFDSTHKELAFGVISEGTMIQTDIQLRRLVEFAIHSRAEMLVIAHNHIAGSPLPSQADRDATRRIYRTLLDIGVKLVDHIVVVGERYYSFAINGIMPE